MFTNSRTMQMLQKCLDNSSITVSDAEQNCQHVDTDLFMQEFDQNNMDLSASFSEISVNNVVEVELENIEIFTEDGINLTNKQQKNSATENIDGNNNTTSNLDEDNNEVEDGNDKDYVPEEESDKDMEQEVSEKTWSVKNRKERKEKRNTGKQYKTVKGILRNARKMRALKSCRKNCNQRISEEQRTHIFDSYWAFASYEKRRRFLVNCVTVLNKKLTKVKIDGKKHKHRENTYLYEFEVSRNEKISVCKACFLATLDESPKFLYSSMVNKVNSPLGVLKDDCRGKHVKTALSEEKLEKVRRHIACFPAYESHYTRSHTKRRYLASHLNLSIMYNLYCEHEEKPVSLASYRKEFQKTGLKFKKPALDTCPTCDALLMTKKSKDEIVRDEAEEKLKSHQEEADKAYETKREDKIISQNVQDMRVIVFDLQQVLPTPLLTSGDVFYKRQFSVYNLTVHDCTTGKATHYMWDESIAKRGSIEIASCIYNALINMPPEIKSVVLYSDTCGGQNKNSNIIAMFIYLLKIHPTLETVDHKFLIAGHTHMECDSDHALIERKSKRSPFPIYHPRDWQQLVRIASKKNKFDVKPMSQTDFLDFSDSFKKTLQKRKLDDNHDQFNFRQLRWLRFSKTEDFGIFQYKTCLDINAPFKKMSYQRKKKIDVSFDHRLPSAYKDLLPISDLKKQNMLSLLDKVDSHAADFYKSLPTVNNLPDFDPDLDRLVADEDIEEK